MKVLRRSFEDGNEELGKKVIEQALMEGITPTTLIDDYITKILMEMGDKFNAGEIFLLDLMAAVGVVEKAMEILKPALEKNMERSSYLGKVIIGTVEGDIHDIGKNIVGNVLFASGFEVIDIGRDVPILDFVRKTKELQPNIIGASAMLTVTRLKQKDLIDTFEKEGLRNRAKILIGGAPCTPEWTKEIGADGYAPDAVKAVHEAKALIGK